MTAWGNAKHIAFARAAQRRLDIANAIDAIGGDPGKRHARRPGSTRPLKSASNCGDVEVRTLRTITATNLA